MKSLWVRQMRSVVALHGEVLLHALQLLSEQLAVLTLSAMT